ncbi:hypothetical protein EUGRSUZ_C00695 [Eucalyptus grandis]|uniref:PGG domain-containing protein n=2 Tax=Eucalyptus grandis TaxID=71139 RepID=A0A059CMX1_EUCGR|nr:hypothetical protein EUGRSUZ_C00695 [Eucalyptus grandis]
MHKTLTVIVTLLATMTFQASITPPGSLWEGDFMSDETTAAHTASESVTTDKFLNACKNFLTYNMISFIASLSIIVLS